MKTFCIKSITPLRLVLALGLLTTAAHAKLNVVVTTPDLGSVVKEIGGDQIELTVLARPTEDPHFVDAKPSFIVKLNKADALVEGGAELETGWLTSLLAGTRNAKIQSGQPGRILCSEGITMREIPAALDRAKGDLHAAGNPHYMMDPGNARIVAQHLTDRLCKLDAKACDAFRANLKKFTAALDAKIVEWDKTLAPHKSREVVAYHNSWRYFSERFGLKIDLLLEPKPGIPPSPAHLAQVITKMKEINARVVIVDPYLNRKTAETVARATEATVVDVCQFPGAVKGTDGGYIALMDYLVNSIAKALSEKK